MSNNIRELTKVEQINGLWVVLVLSPVTGGWIPQGEFPTREAAESNRRNWM